MPTHQDTRGLLTPQPWTPLQPDPKPQAPGYFVPRRVHSQELPRGQFNPVPSNSESHRTRLELTLNWAKSIGSLSRTAQTFGRFKFDPQRHPSPFSIDTDQKPTGTTCPVTPLDESTETSPTSAPPLQPSLTFPYEEDHVCLLAEPPHTKHGYIISLKLDDVINAGAPPTRESLIVDAVIDVNEDPYTSRSSPLRFMGAGVVPLHIYLNELMHSPSSSEDSDTDSVDGKLKDGKPGASTTGHGAGDEAVPRSGRSAQVRRRTRRARAKANEEYDRADCVGTAPWVPLPQSKHEKRRAARADARDARLLQEIKHYW